MTERGAIAFAEKVLTLLDEGSFTATYKYAVLLALMDVCLEQSTRTGAAPTSISTTQLAEKVLELYWPHTVGFSSASTEGSDTRVLFQNQPARRGGRLGGQAAIITAIRKFRDNHAPDPSASLTRARLKTPKRFATLLRTVEWKLVEMPLPRLQTIGDREDAFIYRINWTRRVTRSEFEDPHRFDNAIRFVGEAGEHLVTLAGLLRPLIQRQWAAMVARFNADLVQDAELERFLFGAQRIALGPVREPLIALQRGKCFYCQGSLRTNVQIDHFIPWARYPNNAIENLVAAHEPCNRDKSDHFAATGHVTHWREHLSETGPDLHDVASEIAWETNAPRTLAVARALYLRLPSDALLWAARKKFELVEPDALRGVLLAS